MYFTVQPALMLEKCNAQSESRGRAMTHCFFEEMSMQVFFLIEMNIWPQPIWPQPHFLLLYADFHLLLDLLFYRVELISTCWTRGQVVRGLRRG